MVIQTVSIKKGVIKKRDGVVIFDLEKYKLLEKELEAYRKKTEVLRNLRKFDELFEWGRKFAKKNKITQKQILEDD